MSGDVTVLVRRAGSAAALISLLLLGGCNPEAPRPVPTPSIAWRGARPTGDLEDDAWVKALRESAVALAAATNAANYTDESLMRTWDEGLVLRAAQRARNSLDHGSASVALGPRPFTPVDVQLLDGGQRADVWICTEPMPMLEKSPSEVLVEAEAKLYGLRLDADGERRITAATPPDERHVLPDGQQFDDDYCDSVPIARALFEPAPDLEALLRLDGDDVVAPPSPSPTFAVEVPE
ncbi:hypothetical protein [Cellulomonas wangsupingiae]|uniref:hypothetical protein n=1 Tax=Cellulomonas wangsupingiae TaxID=2968085 RepID=UPI001D0E24AC|nr:hypothetical protein [Cellulomonas wangsupingiae]MCM0639515.1 hypothetical protein [Cellulomonas wangsupingiae]